MKAPKVTLEQLNNKVDGLVKTVGKLSETVNQLSETVDKLAVVTKRGFDEVKDEMGGIKQQLNTLDTLAQGQEDIKLRLDNVAYRFELQDLERRVIVLEKKAKFI